jgi:hypothetical protein
VREWHLASPTRSTVTAAASLSYQFIEIEDRMIANPGSTVVIGDYDH